MYLVTISIVTHFIFVTYKKELCRHFFDFLEIGRHRASIVSLDSACCVSAYLSCLIFLLSQLFSTFEGLCEVEGSSGWRDGQGCGGMDRVLG